MKSLRCTVQERIPQGVYTTDSARRVRHRDMLITPETRITAGPAPAPPGGATRHTGNGFETITDPLGEFGELLKNDIGRVSDEDMAKIRAIAMKYCGANNHVSHSGISTTSHEGKPFAAQDGSRFRTEANLEIYEKAMAVRQSSDAAHAFWDQR